jgi:hypothetical protein
MSVFLVGIGTFALVFDKAGGGWLGGVGFPVVGEIILVLLSECVSFGRLIALWPWVLYGRVFIEDLLVAPRPSYGDVFFGDLIALCLAIVSREHLLVFRRRAKCPLGDSLISRECQYAKNDLKKTQPHCKNYGQADTEGDVWKRKFCKPVLSFSMAALVTLCD